MTAPYYSWGGGATLCIYTTVSSLNADTCRVAKQLAAILAPWVSTMAETMVYYDLHPQPVFALLHLCLANTTSHTGKLLQTETWLCLGFPRLARLQPPSKKHVPAVGSGVDDTWASFKQQESFPAHIYNVDHYRTCTCEELKDKPLAFLDRVQDIQEDGGPDMEVDRKQPLQTNACFLPHTAPYSWLPPEPRTTRMKMFPPAKGKNCHEIRSCVLCFESVFDAMPPVVLSFGPWRSRFNCGYGRISACVNGIFAKRVVLLPGQRPGGGHLLT